MIVFLDGERPKTPLPDMPAAMVMLMIAAYMRCHQPHHVLAEVAIFFWPNGEVEVVRHQTKGQQADIDALPSFTKQLHKSIIVAGLAEDRTPSVATIENMVTIVAQGVACSAWHGSQVSHYPGNSQEKCTLSPFPAQAIRRALYRLSRIAEATRCTVIAMRHLNKRSGGRAIYRGNSSIGVIGHARAGLLVAQDPRDSSKRILAVTKCNLAARPAALRFVLEPSDGVCRIGWLGPAAYQADELVQTPPTEAELMAREDNASKLETCKELLVELLKGGSLAVKQCKSECQDAGISLRTIERAVQQLKVKTRWEMAGGRRIYRWILGEWGVGSGEWGAGSK